MKVIIAGSRDITDYYLLEETVKESGFDIKTVISGYARGVDMLGVEYAIIHSTALIVIKADWDRYGKSAGYRRNGEMLEMADALIAITNGSKGTKHMIDIATKKGIPVYVKEVTHD